MVACDCGAMGTGFELRTSEKMWGQLLLYACQTSKSRRALVCAVNDCWMVRLANDRAGQILGVQDADAFIGRDFWDLVTLRNASVRPSQLFRQQLLEGTDFNADVKAFTSEGRKIWLSCSFSSGTLSQLDDQCPVVSVPVDLTSEPGTKAVYWFVTVQPMADVSGDGAGFNNSFKRAGGEISHAHSLEAGLAGTDFADHFEPQCLQVRPLAGPGACHRCRTRGAVVSACVSGAGDDFNVAWPTHGFPRVSQIAGCGQTLRGEHACAHARAQMHSTWPNRAARVPLSMEPHAHTHTHTHACTPT